MRVGDGAPTPLGDLRVVEVSDRIPGGYCGKLLVDAGADIVKVEPVTGDPLRRVTATGAAPPSRGDSPLFSYLNAGKRSVTTVSEELLARADIVIVASTRTAAIERGIDPWKLLENAPQSIVVSVSDFGWTGPWAERPATEFTLQAWSGLTGFRGDPAGPPISIGGGAGRVHGRCLRRVRSTGPAPEGPPRRSRRAPRSLDARGDHVYAKRRVAALAVARGATDQAVRRSAIDRASQGRLRRHQHGDRSAVARLRRDGGLSRVHPGLPICASNWDDGPTATGFGNGIAPWVRERTVAEIVELGQLFRRPIAPLGNGSTIPQLDHMRERGVYVDNPTGFRQPRAPWLMPVAMPARCARRPYSVGPTTIPPGSKGIQRRRRHHRAELAVGRYPNRRPLRVLGRAVGDALVGRVRRGRDQGRVDPGGRTASAIRVGCVRMSTTGGDRIRACGAAGFAGAGAMVSMLWNQPADPSDAELPIRFLSAAPISADMYRDIEARYGCRVVTMYGLTEAFPIGYRSVCPRRACREPRAGSTRRSKYASSTCTESPYPRVW